MSTFGKRWTVRDRDGNLIYMTDERWHHITEPNNHPEVAAYEDALKDALQKGRRRQEPLNPRKYRYTYSIEGGMEDFNSVVVIVLFGFDVDDQGTTIANNFVATAFLKHIHPKGGVK